MGVGVAHVGKYVLIVQGAKLQTTVKIRIEKIKGAIAFAKTIL